MRRVQWSWVIAALVIAVPNVAHAQSAPASTAEAPACSLRADAASGGRECLAANTLAELTHCASTTRPLPPPTAPVAPPAPAQTATPPVQRTHGEGGIPADMLVPRDARLQQMTDVLLQREAQLTLRLLVSLPPNAPNRPDVMLRLVAILDELARASVRASHDLDGPAFEAQQRHDDARAAEIAANQQRLQARATAARNDLVAQLAPFLSGVGGSSPRADEMFFLLAATYADLHRSDDARRAYAELIQRFPLSHYVNAAYVWIGDTFFDAGQLAEARAFYERVTAHRSPDNRLYAYALYKLAWVAYNQSDYEASLHSFVGVIEYARQFPDDASATALVPVARNELVVAYGALYGGQRALDTDQAFQTFARVSTDENQAIALLEKLAELYRDNGQWSAAVATYHALMARRPRSDSLCAWQAGIARAALASARPEAQQLEITRLLDVYDSFRDVRANRPVPAREQCRDETARVAFDAASHWHASVVSPAAGAPVIAGPDRTAALTRALALYNALLQRFPDLDAVTYPEFDRRDWPTRYRIAYYRAMVLREQSEQCECGPAFDGVVELDPTGAFTEDAAYRAVLCYNDCFTQQSATRPTLPHATDAASDNHLSPREFTGEETGMIRAFSRYVCAVRAPGAPAGASTADLLLIRYRRAYVYYRANHFEEAAVLFREIALSDPSVPDPERARETAAGLYLDSLNAMAYRWDPPRAACGETLATAVDEVRGHFCGESTATASAEFCEDTERVACDVSRHRAASLHRAGCHLESARALVSLVRSGAHCDDLDEVLNAGAAEFDESHRLGQAIRVREALVQRFLGHNSHVAEEALFRLAGNYQAVQIYSRAAELYEQYAQYVHEHQLTGNAAAQAADALRRATAFRIGLGEEDRALADAATFGRYFAGDSARRRQAAAVEFAVGQIYQDRARRLSSASGGTDQERVSRQSAVREAWSAVVSHYTGYLSRYARSGTLDERVQGEASVARGYWNLGDEPHALEHYRAASEAWGRAGQSAPAPGETRVRAQLGADADGAVDAARESVAEARFYLAEGVYQRFSSRRLPEFHGGRNARAFREWEQRVLQPFVERQLSDLRGTATPAYSELLAMGVPSWEIAAAERLADMYYQIGMYIHDAPVPPEVRADEVLYAEYLQLRERFEGQFRGEATHGFELCLTTAERAQWFNEWSQLCERRLNAIDARRYPLADEVHVEPGLVYSRPANSEPVYEVDGASDTVL